MSLALDDVQRAFVVLDADQPVEIRQYRPISPPPTRS